MGLKHALPCISHYTVNRSIRKLHTNIYQNHIQFETNIWYEILVCLQRSGIFLIPNLIYLRIWLVCSDTNYSICDWMFYTEIRIVGMFYIRDPMQIHPYSYASGIHLVCAALSYIAKKCMYYILLSNNFFQ